MVVVVMMTMVVWGGRSSPSRCRQCETELRFPFHHQQQVNGRVQLPRHSHGGDKHPPTELRFAARLGSQPAGSRRVACGRHLEPPASRPLRPRAGGGCVPPSWELGAPGGGSRWRVPSGAGRLASVHLGGTWCRGAGSTLLRDRFLHVSVLRGASRSCNRTAGPRVRAVRPVWGAGWLASAPPRAAPHRTTWPRCSRTWT